MASPKEKITTIINTGAVIGSTYAQVVGVTVTDNDITLEFAFINPRDKTKGQVVSRVTLPFVVGMDLAQTLMDTVRMHDKRKKGELSD